MADEPDPKPNRVDFAAARKAFVDDLVSQFEGISHQDFNGIDDPAEFRSHAAALVEQRVNADREAGARALGISLEEFDALKAKPAKEESTPESRAANLPTGRSAPPPAQTQNTSSDGASGVDLMEQAARDFLTESGYLTK